MPTQVEVTEALELTSTGKMLLGAYLRASLFYLSFSWAFTGLDEDLAAVTGDRSKMLSAILTQIEDLGDGTVGAQGGEFGADYSQPRDREQLCMLALSVIYDFAALGIVVSADGKAVTSGQGFALGSSQRGGVMPSVGNTFEKIL